jgi:replicative DNA helicase
MDTNRLKYSNTTPLPNNFLAEQAILNILLTNSSLVKTALQNLKLESFYFEPHRLIYQMIIELSEKNQSINLTTVITELENQGLLKKIGGIEKIVNIINRFEIFSELENYISLVNEKYLRRLLIELGKQIIIWGYTTSKDITELLDKTEQSIYSLNQQKVSQKIYTAAEIVDDVFNELKAKIKKDSSSGLLTSFKDLDAIIQGFENSDLIVIAGRPSMGKTAFSLNLGKNIVNSYNVPLLIFSLEMSRQQIIYRFISTNANINSNRLKSGKMSSKEWEALSAAMRNISDLPIFIDDNPNLSLIEIRSKLRKILVEKKKKGLVIIDYLQLMKLNIKFENRSQEISYITRNLKILAKEFQVPIIILSQLSRNVEARTNKRPMLSDLRESGSIEQDADIVIMLYREEYYTEKKNDLQITEFIVAKHRNGPVGTAKLLFNANTTSFNNI